MSKTLWSDRKPKDLIKLSKAHLVYMIGRLNLTISNKGKQLKESSLKLSMARITISDQQHIIARVKISMEENKSKVRSMKKTITRRRKTGKKLQHGNLVWTKEEGVSNG